MVKRMLIDATQSEETRVAVIEGDRLEEFEYESAMRKPLKGNIYLAKVTRVEPSLQAAFVSYGGNRHGFLPFSEIHPDYFRIPVADQEEFERMQREQLEEHDKLEASDLEDLEADLNEGDDVEAGGNDIIEAVDIDSDDEVAVDAATEDDNEADADLNESAESDNALDSDDNEASGDNEGDVAESDSAENEADEDSEASSDVEVDDADQGEADNEGEQDGNRGRGRHGRGRGRGRHGRGRGRGRRNFRSRRPENFGDDEAGQAQRFRFNLRRKYKIQEVIKRGQIMLIQVSREERGNKGAAVSSYLSLPGRYCVLMPNSPRGGGVSRKISNQQDRSKMKDLLGALEVPAGMSTIVRTAGVTRTKTEVKRDLDYLMRLWNSIRELTLKSTAPSLVYEEADLIKRSVRDQYTRDIEEILVAGQDGYKSAKGFMKMLMPSHAKRVKLYEDTDISLFHRYKVERQIAEIGETEVTLPSGGYLVINPTEALVSVDVNSGRSTKERNIEGTALKTNLEAAEEVARQLRLRDLGGLVVIDFIDMEDRRNNGKVERKMREALSGDRARVQVGRISSFGLMELSRQRLNASLSEAQFEVCPHCEGRGRIRTADSASLLVLRAIEAEGVKKRAAQVIVHVPANVALYLLNYKRPLLSDIEGRYGIEVLIRVDDELPASVHRLEVSKPLEADDTDSDDSAGSDDDTRDSTDDSDDKEDGKKSRRGRRGGRGRGRNRRNRGEDGDSNEADEVSSDEAASDESEAEASVETSDSSETQDKPKRRRRKPAAKKAKADDVSENDAETSAGESDAGEASADNSDANAEDEPKKPVKRRGRKKKIDIEEASADSDNDKGDADQGKGEGKSEAKVEANTDADDKAEEEKPKKRGRKPAAKKAKADKVEAEAPSEVNADAKTEAAAAAEDKADTKPAAQETDKPQAEPSAASEHEVVNQKPKKKRLGWWNRGK